MQNTDLLCATATIYTIDSVKKRWTGNVSPVSGIGKSSLYYIHASYLSCKIVKSAEEDERVLK